jgi:hypothetical protein
MALTGQLSDMSLAELIEFFCNQRKTGRLKVDYHRGHGVFFIKDGELVDAKVGALSGAEAVYFALTLPNAAFDFSADFEPTRRTIKESWTQIVLEGLRRLDEGVSPSEADAFGGDWSPSESDLAMFMDHIERLGANEAKDEAAAKEAASGDAGETHAPMSMMVESASGSDSGGKKKLMVMGAVAACVILACAVVAIPLARKFGGSSKPADAANSNAAQPEVSTANASSTDTNNAASSETADASPDAANAEAQTDNAAPSSVDPNAAALAARREAREREARERARRLDEAKKNDSADKTTTDAAAATVKPIVAPAAASGPKVVRVSVSYDEAGRVTQASVAGATSGAEAYGGTAVRIARGRHFPAGKAGNAVVTIPVN